MQIRSIYADSFYDMFSSHSHSNEYRTVCTSLSLFGSSCADSWLICRSTVSMICSALTLTAMGIERYVHLYLSLGGSCADS